MSFEKNDMELECMATKLLSLNDCDDENENKNTYRTKKYRMKKDIDTLFTRLNLSKSQKNIVKGIFELSDQVKEPERQRSKIRQLQQQNRVLQEKLSLAEAFYTNQAMEKFKNQQSEQKCELAQSLDVSRERNRRLATQIDMLQSKIEDIRDNNRIVSNTEWDAMVYANAINVVNGEIQFDDNDNNTENKKLKKENKKLKKQIQALMTVDDSSSDDDSE